MLTVAVVGILRPVDVPELVDHQKPLRATVEPSDPNVSSLHVVVVPGVALVFGAVGHRLSITHSADQQHQTQSTRKLRQFPSQRPFAHYTAFLKESMIHILKAKLGLDLQAVGDPSQYNPLDGGVTSDLRDLLRAGGGSSVFVSAVNDTNQQTDATVTHCPFLMKRQETGQFHSHPYNSHIKQILHVFSVWPVQYLERVYIYIYTVKPECIQTPSTSLTLSQFIAIV